MKIDEDRMVIAVIGTDLVAGELASTAPSSVGAETITISDNKKAGIYELQVNGQTAAGLLYTETGRRVTIRSTAVFRAFRGKGIAGKLLGGVLDLLRAEGRTATLTCPFANAFVRTHPEYADVVDSAFPGSAHGHTH